MVAGDGSVALAERVVRPSARMTAITGGDVLRDFNAFAFLYEALVFRTRRAVDAKRRSEDLPRTIELQRKLGANKHITSEHLEQVPQAHQHVEECVRLEAALDQQRWALETSPRHELGD